MPNDIEIKGKCQMERGAAIAEIERLIRVEKLSLESVSARVKMSLITVRRVCRTLGLGRYASEQGREGPVATSSQVPFGWEAEQGILRENPTEMKWVHRARELRQAGESYRAIARYFERHQVPTKNGGQWHGKTIIQILEFNDRISLCVGNSTEK